MMNQGLPRAHRENQQSFLWPGAMSSRAWTDAAKALNVAGYFAMLADDVAGPHYDKAAYRRQLSPRLDNRSEGSVELEQRTIGAVLKGPAKSGSRATNQRSTYRPA
jgi:hypothetical protein